MIRFQILEKLSGNDLRSVGRTEEVAVEAIQNPKRLTLLAMG